MEQLTRARIEDAAYKGLEMPEKLNPFEQIYYHGMSFIFGNYKKQLIRKEKIYEYRTELIKEIDAIEQEVSEQLKRGGGA